MIHKYLLFCVFFGCLQRVVAQPTAVVNSDSTRLQALQTADTLFSTAFLLQKQRKFASSDSLIERCKAIRTQYYGPAHHDIALCWEQLALTQFSQNKFSAALDLYRRAAAIHYANDGANSINLARVHVQIGTIFLNLGSIDSAAYYYNDALAVRLKQYGAQHIETAGTYFNIGNISFMRGNLDSAQANFQRALDISRAAGSTGNELAARCLASIGNLFLRKEDMATARRYFEESIALYQQVDPKHSNIARITAFLANCYSELGDFERAELLYLDALQRQEARSKTGLDVVETCANLAVCSNRQRKFKQSLVWSGQAIDLVSKYYPQQKNLMGMLLGRRGTALLETGQPDSAVICFAQTVELLRPAPSAGFPMSYILDLSNLGKAYQQTGAIAQADSCFQQALQIAAQYNQQYSAQMLAVRLGLANVYFQTGQIEQATIQMDTILQKVDCASCAGNYQTEQVALVAIFKLKADIHQQLYLKKGDKTELYTAVSWYERAMQALFDQVGGFTAEGSQLFQLQEVSSVVEAALTACTRSADPALTQRAYTIMERSKGLLLRSGLAASKAANFGSIPDSVVQDLRATATELATWQKKYFQSENNTEARSQINRLLDQKAQLITKIKTAYPDYYQLTVQHEPIPLADLQQYLRSDGQTILEYFTGDSAVFIVLISAENCTLQQIRFTTTPQQLITNLRQGITAYYTDPAPSDQLYDTALLQYEQNAAALYQLLVQPVAASIGPKVIIVPDGILWQLPFETLLTRSVQPGIAPNQYPYWLLDKTISYTFSATLHEEIRQRKPKTKPNLQVLAMAPYFDASTSVSSRNHGFDANFKALPFSGKEVQMVHNQLSGDLFLGKKATMQQFVQSAGRYKTIHLATHAGANMEQGDYSFLMFQGPDAATSQVLYGKDIYNLQLNAELVTLSACETGLGKIERGEGLIGLARAFTYSGARTVVPSLWQVNDESTGILMRSFYQSMKTGQTTDKSMQTAKKKMVREQAVFAHPFFWAPFVVVGG